MLYQLHEFQRAALEPWRWWAQASAATLVNPYSPLSYAPSAKKVAAGLDLMLRLTKRYGRPDFAIETVDVASKPATVREEVWLDTPFCQLLHFAKSRSARHEPVVLVFAPLSGHFATLLRDTARTLLPDHDVVITDWKNARDISLSNGPFHFDDYAELVQRFVRHVRERAGKPVHVVSVCQPTVPVLAGISLMASRGEETPASMTMMGGPIDTRKNPTSVNDFAMRRPLSWFEQNVIQRVPVKYEGAMRRVYPGFMQLAGFIAMNPGRHFDSHKDYYRHLIEGDGDSAEAHRRFYDEYNAVMDLPAEYYLDTIVRVFHEQRLARGTLSVGSEPVTPAKIRKSALFTIEGEIDDISGCGQTQAAHQLCTGIPAVARQHYTAPAVGHYGIFSGRKFRETIYPRIRAFIASHEAK
ncbi:MAG TPA: polyhydroxyalkanoate depolymerase [Usitatibacteraceae bacterium]|nr:polyhydroxyalkanoate depolymerase [Usitatibacteraceae bacterium]